MNKTICFTIDIEPDFGGLLKKDQFFGIENMPKLEKIVKKYDLKLTAFVTGKTLEENKGLVESLRNMKAEIEQHSYSHEVGINSLKDIKKGIETHERIIGTKPRGYRAPWGIINLEQVRLLEKLGFLFDSSIFPTFFPGRFNNLNFPIQPFRIKDSNLIEFPFSVIPKIRIPISLSYIQLLGLNTFKFLLQKLGFPELIVYDSHSFELGKNQSYRNLALASKILYFRSQYLYSDPASVFEDFIKYIFSKGYQSKYLIDVFEEIKSKDLPRSWNKN